MTDEQYHNVGVGMNRKEPDLGRYRVTGQEEDRGAFKTPTLRNIAQTAPYMHDNSLSTLRHVVEFFAQGGIDNPHLSSEVEPLDLSEQDKEDLVEFLKACTGPLPPVNPGRLPVETNS